MKGSFHFSLRRMLSNFLQSRAHVKPIRLPLTGNATWFNAQTPSFFRIEEGSLLAPRKIHSKSIQRQLSTVNPEVSSGPAGLCSEATKRIEESFELKALHVGALIDRGENKEAVLAFGSLLRLYDTNYKKINYLLYRLLINPDLPYDPIKLNNLSLLAKANFFKGSITDEVWRKVVHDSIFFAIKQRIFCYWEDFGLGFRNMILAITATHHQKPGEEAISNILNQIISQHQATAHNAVLSCFDVAIVPDVFDGFALGLLENMHGVLPASDSVAVVLDRLLIRFNAGGPLQEMRLSKAMELYNMLSSSGLALRQSVSLSLCSALCNSKNQFGSDLVHVACDIIENRYPINQELGRSILLALTKSIDVFPTSYLSHYLRTPTKEWDYCATTALWEALKSSSLDVEESFYVVLHCFSVVAKDSNTIDASLKEMFHGFLRENPPVSTRPFEHLVAAIKGLNLDYTFDLLRQYGIVPNAGVINAILHYYTLAGYHNEALNCFQGLLIGSNKVDKFMPDGETLALAFHASCKAQAFVQAEEFCKAYFNIVSTTPRPLREYIALLNGFTSILKIRSDHPKYIYKRADWAVRKAYYLLRQTQMSNYRGPTTHLYSCIVKIYSLYAHGVGKDHSASKAYESLLEKFDELIVENSLNISSVVYANLFRGLANVISLKAVKQNKVIADLDRILSYMGETHVKMNPQVFLSLFLVFKAAKLPQRVEFTFSQFVEIAKAGDLCDRDFAAAAINMYIAARPLTHKEIHELFQTMDDLGIDPDEHTFIHLFKSLARQKASLAEFRSCIRLITRYMTPRSIYASEGQLEISVKLLGTVANSFSFSFGAGEMTKAVKFLLSTAESSNRLKQVPLDFFVHLVRLSLKPNRYNRGEQAFLWLETLSKLSRTSQTMLSLQSALTLIANADQALSVHLAAPNLKWRIDAIRNSIAV